MKNVFVLLLAIVMTGGLLFGANAVNANNAVQTAEMSGSCCPSTTTTIQMHKIDAGGCTGDAAPITAEKEASCHDEIETKSISGEGCPSSGHCPGTEKSQLQSPSKKSI